MTTATGLGRLSIQSSSDVVAARQRVRDAAASLGFDQFDQVQIATGVSEIARELAAGGGGELDLSVVQVRPRRLIIEARATRSEGFPKTELTPALAAARRLLGGPVGDLAADGKIAFSRLVPKPLTPANVEAAARVLSAGGGDPYHELEVQNHELIGALEALRVREADLESLNRELEETNRGVLALYAELDDKAESLRRASDERSRFLSNVTHELRTPLSSIMALCRLLLSESGATLTGEQAKQIGYIQKSAQDLHEFVSDLLDLAKVEAGKIAVRPGPFELEDVFSALRGMFRPLATDPAVALVFEPCEVPQLVTDEHKVGQVLRNLISNALKFTERGEVRVRAFYDPARDEVAVAVADTGTGIDADALEHIFEEFVQVDARTGRRERGTGLGLPLSRNLAQLMGGSLTVESEAGVGSTFTLRVPRVFEPPRDARAERTGYVLVVDDDRISRYVAREQLERVGWRVVEAADGEMALRLAAEADCRAIVLDLLMPGMSGFEVLEKLGRNEATAGVPVVIRTSLPIAEIDGGAVARAAGVFSKHDDSIEVVVDRLLASTRRSAAAARTSS